MDTNKKIKIKIKKSKFKKKNCKKLNPFDCLPIILHVKELNMDKLYNKIKDYEAVKLRHRKWKKEYIIIHKSQKKPGRLQVSYFDEHGAIRDIIRDSLKEIIPEIVYSYNIIEETI